MTTPPARAYLAKGVFMESLFETIAQATKPELIRCGLYENYLCDKGTCAECCKAANQSNDDEE